ncbi:hypothetical protein [Bradyrhizobium monzae]|uniref:hypothetical protein n=1 Tax=Bradyrhizobium sp. Oc8 TaxID=2876780 RepID=UPI001F2354F9|nr:hypothetical protein [Bradyrhizobium sp. Oc8]
MSIIIGWLILSAVVSVAASSRGRNGAWWFVIAVITSPLIAVLFVFGLPNLRHEELLSKLANREPERPLRRIGGHSSRVTVDRSPKPFEPDGVLGGVPYRVIDDGSIHAIMQGALVKFASLEQFTKAVGN